jgi:MATE family multidrug resistance protein
LGAAELAAGTIVLNLASVSFMVPLGVAIGTAARVGNLIGAGHSRAAQRSAWVALGLGALFMSFFAMLFVVFRHTLPTLYTSDATTIALAAGALPIAAAFQLFDGTQVVGGAILRGMGKTRPAALFNLLGYYAIALPLGAWLAFRAGWGLRGLWCGLAAGLMVVATALVIWIWRRGPAHVPTT